MEGGLEMDLSMLCLMRTSRVPRSHPHPITLPAAGGFEAGFPDDSYEKAVDSVHMPLK